MRTLIQINKDFKYFKSSLVYFIFCFMITPIVLGFLYGALYEKMLTPEIEINPIKIYISETEKDIYIPILKQLLNAEELDFIHVENILPNEIDLMTKKNRKSLGIKEEGKIVQILNYGPSSTEKNIVSNLIMPLTTTLSHLNVKAMTGEQRTKFIQDYLLLSVKDFTKIENVGVHKKLTSYQLMIVSVYMALSFFIATTFAVNFLKEREHAVIQRLFSLDITKRFIYINTVLSVFIMSLLLVTSYSFFAYGILLKMKISFVQMLIINFIHAGFIAALYGVFIGLFRSERVFKNSITPIIMAIMILGGSFFPIDMFQNLAKFVHFMPNYNLLKLYEGVLLGTSLRQLVYPISFMIGVMVILIMVGMFKFSVREGKTC